MARIEGIDPNTAEGEYQRIFDGQARKWGSPLSTHLIYARRPTIFRGARGMWAGLDASRLLGGALHAIINRRVATINRCEF